MTVAALSLIILFNLWQIGAKVIFHRENPELFGWSSAVVLSGSMEPAFSAGDLLLIHRKDSYRTGDIITFSENGALITHRIAKETGEGFITKGDANNVPDNSPVSAERISGKVTAVIPGAGTVLLFFGKPAGLLALFFVSGLLLWGEDILHLTERTGRKPS